ncbi:MAG: CapA family protein [Candidatus Bathyarchaeota archaeon]|nr:MAG: CapA family protein [Candidatus Bathyarchaeota archaeon]
MGSHNCSICCVGDAFISRRLSVHQNNEQFFNMIKILRGADVSVLNLETAIHSFEGYPLGEGKGDAYGQADPYIADEIKWAGFDLVSRANNHSMDYTVGGLIATTKHLDRVGLAHAGAGMDLAEARAPACLETPKGIVSIISATTYNLAFASYPRLDLQGRPGVNPLRIQTTYYLDSYDFHAMKKIVKALNMWQPKSSEDGEEFFFPPRQQVFKLAKETKTVYTINETDFENNIKAIQNAKKLSDWVIFSLHDHYDALTAPEGYNTKQFTTDPIESFARASIDAGVDVFFSHGTHMLRGLEIYKRKPIFYGLGNFVFQSTLIKKQPSDLFEKYGLSLNSSTTDLYEKREKSPRRFFNEQEYWESVLVHCLFQNKNLIELKLYPLTLNYHSKKPLREQRTTAGIPSLATKTLGKKIIKDMNYLSSKYGTEIRYHDGIGVVII